MLAEDISGFELKFGQVSMPMTELVQHDVNRQRKTGGKMVMRLVPHRLLSSSSEPPEDDGNDDDDDDDMSVHDFYSTTHRKPRFRELGLHLAFVIVLALPNSSPIFSASAVQTLELHRMHRQLENSLVSDSSLGFRHVSQRPTLNDDIDSDSSDSWANHQMLQASHGPSHKLAPQEGENWDEIRDLRTMCAWMN